MSTSKLEHPSIWLSVFLILVTSTSLSLSLFTRFDPLSRRDPAPIVPEIALVLHLLEQVLHQIFKEGIVWLLLELQLATVLKVLVKGRRHSLAKIFDRSQLFEVSDLAIVLLTLQVLPG